jgi:hypothetical protein
MSTETATDSLVPSRLSPYAKFKMELKSKEVQRIYKSIWSGKRFVTLD